MTMKSGLRVKQAVAAGLLASVVAVVPVVSASADATLTVNPGGSFSMSGDGCLFGSTPGSVGIGLIDVDDVESADPYVWVLPELADADAQGVWSGSYSVSADQPDGLYYSVPVCLDLADPEHEPFGMEDEVEMLQVGKQPSTTTTSSTTSTTIDPGTPTTVGPTTTTAGPTTTINVPPPPLNPGVIDKIAKPGKPASVKTKPKFTG